MPTYEYICDACGKEYEKFQSITSKPDRVCPKCKARKVRRKIGIGSAVIFKGSGFYETDYRSEGYTKAAEADRKSSETPKADASSANETSKPGAEAAKPASGATAGSAASNDSKKSGADSSAAKATTSEPTKTSSDEKPRRSSKEGMAAKAVHPSRVGRGQGNLRRKTK
ncbi:MAG: hypothetical protein K8R92_00045 [Planctomycetes bacterium]|nr:hypothetical protein [Planctomycetota bacterium]